MNSSVTSYAVNVSILGDDIFEFTESFRVGLALGAPLTFDLSLNPEEADIEILDDDGEEFSNINIRSYMRRGLLSYNKQPHQAKFVQLKHCNNNVNSLRLGTSTSFLPVYTNGQFEYSAPVLSR